MPHYLFTITFDSLKSVKQKNKLIGLLYELHSLHINDYAELYYTVEYHKKADKKSNNYFRPHVHGILTTAKLVPRYKMDALIDALKTKYGNTQYSLQEDEDEVVGWREYCDKDIKFNEEYTKLKHSFHYALQPVGQKDFDELFQLI